jgi:hypothetical protein
MRFEVILRKWVMVIITGSINCKPLVENQVAAFTGVRAGCG